MPYFCHYDGLLSCLSDVFVYMIFQSAKWLQKKQQNLQKNSDKKSPNESGSGMCDDIMRLFSAPKAL